MKVGRRFNSGQRYMANPKFKKNDRVFFKPKKKNATIVAADPYRSLKVAFYIIRVDGESSDTYNVKENELR